mgnify:CR=1 FL=1
MALNIKPLADRVLVEPSKAETKTASGIIIPDNATLATWRVGRGNLVEHFDPRLEGQEAVSKARRNIELIEGVCRQLAGYPPAKAR